jgi:dethiobiotin synthetase
MRRPSRLVFVAGTGTEIGKTWVGAALLGELRRRGHTVAARKPVQSFARGSGPTDAEVLASATGESPERVCSDRRSYAVALAPPMATDALGAEPFTIADLAGEMHWDGPVDVGLVEGVGGVRSPLASDGDTVDLIRALEPDDVVLVADAELGTINAVRLSVAALAPYSSVVFVNRYDPACALHRRNFEWLAQRDGLTVATDIGSLADLVRHA